MVERQSMFKELLEFKKKPLDLKDSHSIKRVNTLKQNETKKFKSSKDIYFLGLVKKYLFFILQLFVILFSSIVEFSLFR